MTDLFHALTDQLTFLWPWMIILLPLPWLIHQLLPPAPAQPPLHAPTLYDTARSALKTLPNRLRQPARFNGIPVWAWLLWGLAVLAAMRPVWYLTPTDFHQQGRNLMLAVDLSGSMEKRDMRLHGQAVDRLTAVKAVVKDFIHRRQGDRIGLIVFGSQAFLVSPLTHDLQTVATLLQETDIGMAGDNTAIGDAIGLALRHLRHMKPGHSVLILLTDGANTDGKVEPLEAARMAALSGLRIHTIAIGREAGRGGGYDYDEKLLQSIASLTGGQFFTARNRDQLEQIYDRIDQLERSSYTLHTLRAHTELFHWPLGAALLFSFLIAFRRSRGIRP